MKTLLQTLHISHWRTTTKEGVNAYELMLSRERGKPINIGKERAYDKKLIMLTLKARTVCPITHPSYSTLIQYYK